jgi:pimeloyl-ACP methyl ester carboxylesterase
MLGEAFTDLPEVLDAAGLDDTILIGHSDGATIAAAYAGKIKARVRGLVAMTPHFFVEDICIRAITAMQRAFETTDLKQKMARFHDDVEGAFYGWAASWLQEKFLDFNTEKYLPMLEIPVLGIQGYDDEYGTMAQLDALEAKAGGPVELLKLENCSHMAHRDQGPAITEAIGRFVAKLL